MILLDDTFSRIYELVNAITHLLNEHSLTWHTNSTFPTACVRCALCVHVRQETLAIPSNLLEWHIHFLLFHTIAACVIISIHSSQLNGILQDDEVNAVFFCSDSHPESS